MTDDNKKTPANNSQIPPTPPPTIETVKKSREPSNDEKKSK